MSENQETVITVEMRDELGKEAVTKLRRDGLLPAVVYGGGKPPVAIKVAEQDILDMLKATGENTIFTLKLKGKKEERRAMIKEMQADPMTGRLLHADFIRVTRGHKLTVTVPLSLTGEPAGLKLGGRLDVITREITVEILPREMISELEVDISSLGVGDNISIGEIVDLLPESAEVQEEHGRVIALVAAPKAVEEEEEEDEALETEESAEPEVIKKGKDEDEE
jgi:large subunit ribosomal protein L25